MTDKKEVQLKVMEALQEEAYKGIVRIDSHTMTLLGVHPGDVIEIEGTRITVGVVDRAYPSDVGQSIIRMDGILRRNAKTGIGETVRVRQAEVKEAKSIVIAPAQKGIMVQAHPDVFKRGLLGRAVVKGDIVALGGTRRRRRTMAESPFFDDIFNFEDTLFDNFGFSSLKFIVVDTTPKQPLIITETTEIKVNPKAVDVVEESIPEVTYEDIGGLKEEVKKIREMVELPLRHPEIFKRLGIEPPAGVLLHGPPGCGKTLLAKAVANESEAHFILVNGPEIMNKYYGESEKRIRQLFEDAEKNAPSIIFIDEIDAIAPKREDVHGELERRVVAQLLSMMDGLKSRGKVVVIAATNRPNAIDPALRRPGRFDREIPISVPNKKGRLNILKIHTRNMPMTEDVKLEKLAEVTHGFVGADVSALAKEAAMNVLRRLLPDIKLQEKEPISKELLEKLVVTDEDFQAALKIVRPSAMREILVEIPNVKWSRVGGLESTKQELKEAVEWPLKYPNAFKNLSIKPPRWILLYGPPGCGKTLLAKAVANESQANFILIKGPELLNKFVGESERGVRKIFEKARQLTPAIIFFDEADSIVPRRGGYDNSGVTERVVNTLLSEMDGLEELNDVIVMAASVTGDTPVLVKENGETKLVNIGEFIDKYYEKNEENVEKPAGNIEVLGFEKIDGKKIKGTRFKNSAFKKVRSVFRHKVNEIYEIEFIGGKIRTTGNHSVFVRTKKGVEFKPVSKLKEGEYLVDLPYKTQKKDKYDNLRAHNFNDNRLNLVLPVYEFDPKLQQDYEFSLNSQLSQSQIASQIGVVQTTVSNWRNNRCVPRGLSLDYYKHSLPSLVNVTPGLMRLFGYYVAEGYARKEIDFCFNKKEIGYIKDVQHLMKNIFGLNPQRVRTLTKNAINLTYQSKPLADFLIRYCGKGAKNKQIPSFLFECPREYFLEFLRGYAAGDGHVNSKGGIEITSISKNLIFELNWLCRMHGIKTYISSFTAKSGRKIGDGNIINKTSLAFRLGIPASNNPFNKNSVKSLSRRAKIKSIKRLSYDGYVYDFCGCENEAFFGGETPILLHNTNRPDMLDPALLRPGRFDRMILVSVPDEKSRLEIFNINTKDMPIATDVDLAKLAKETKLYTGADIENVCREAGILALRENIKSREVTMKHFEDALKKTRSSVTEEDLEAYKMIEERFFKSARGAAIRKEIPTYFG